MRAVVRLVMAGCILLLCNSALAALPHEIKACGDVNEYAPYTFFGDKELRSVTGYSVDVTNLILKDHKLTVTLLPWKRCLALAANGEFDLVFDTRIVPDRLQSFTYTRPYYTITPIVAFRKNAPLGPIRSVNDLRKVRVCKILGWDYTIFGMAQPPTSGGAPSSLSGAIAMLRAGRCDALILNLELMPELHFEKQDLHTPELGYQPLPGLEKADMYMMVSKAVPHQAELLDMVNTGIERLQKAGELDRILRRYQDAKPAKTRAGK